MHDIGIINSLERFPDISRVDIGSWHQFLHPYTEFDDLELCTSLSCRDGAFQWWSGQVAVHRAEGDVASLQQQVEDLQVQLSRSQALVLSLQSRLQAATPNSTLQKSNQNDQDMRELVTRISSLEEQLRKGKGHAEEEAKSNTRPGWVINTCRLMVYFCITIAGCNYSHKFERFLFTSSKKNFPVIKNISKNCFLNKITPLSLPKSVAHNIYTYRVNIIYLSLFLL